MTLQEYTSSINIIKRTYTKFDKLKFTCKVFKLWVCYNNKLSSASTAIGTIYDKIDITYLLFNDMIAIIYIDNGNLIVLNNGKKQKIKDITKLNLNVDIIITIDNCYDIDIYKEIWIKYFNTEPKEIFKLLIQNKYNSILFYINKEDIRYRDKKITHYKLGAIKYVESKPDFINYINEILPDTITYIRNKKLLNLLK